MDFIAQVRRARVGARGLMVLGTLSTACNLGSQQVTTASEGSSGTSGPEGTSTSGSSGTADTGTTSGTTTGTSGPSSTDGSSTDETGTQGSSSSSGAAPGVCGDGELDRGEECDDGNNADDDACLSDCMAAFCGDGEVHHGEEECDDGNLDEDDGCTLGCVIQICGDGVLQGAETCDDGNNVDTDACPTSCEVASCGDGFTHEGEEDCDAGGESAFCDPDCSLPKCGDGYVNGAAGELCDAGGEETAQCDPDCSLPVCGDGFASKAAGEECDDGNGSNGDGCSSVCTKEKRVVFVTSSLYSGNLGGVAGADAKCQQLATAAGLAGTFLAWISDNAKSPNSRFLKSSVPYVLPSGQQVAKSYADLTDGSLTHAIDQTEKGMPPPAATLCGGKPTVWTNTLENGTKWDSDICGSFTNTTGAGRFGTSVNTNLGWTHACNGAAGTCAWKAPLYCFEQ